VSADLVRRFHEVIRRRRQSGVKEKETLNYWDDSKRLLVAGLVEYCGVGPVDVAELLGRALQRPLTESSILSLMHKSRKAMKYPFHAGRELPQDSESIKRFVQIFNGVTNMSLEDLISWILQRGGRYHRATLKKLDSFRAEYLRLTS
jgi:hypothetical protein